MQTAAKKQNIIWLVLFALSFALMLWKLPYGFGGDDEGFYLTLANRLCMGERLFSDEWHLSQLSSFFTYPLVFLFRKFNGTNEGILLFSRCVYLLCHSAASAVVYLRLRKYGAGAILASLFFILFTPFDMMTVSYNTIALDTLALAGVFACTGAMLPSGIFFACAVVCCPYLAAVYLLYFIVSLLYKLLRKKTGKEFFSFPLFTLKNFFRFSIGIAVVLALFMLFFFSHCGVKELIRNLPGIFSDPEHPTYSLFFKLKRYVYCILTCHPCAWLPIGLYVLTLAALFFDRGRKKRILFYMLLSSASAVLWFCLFLPKLTENYYNAIMLPLTLVGFSAYILLKNRPRELFVGIFLPGILYSICVCATSNMGFTILSIAFSVVNMASLIFIILLIRENRVEKSAKALSAACLAPVALLGALILTVKVNHCFWDASPSKLDAEITLGPAKGIVTNEYFRWSYETICRDMSSYADKSGNILVYSQQAWSYLIPENMHWASFSAWLSGLDEATNERLRLYYELNPDKAPDCIYIPKTSAFGDCLLTSEDINSAAEKYGFSVEENAISYKLDKLPDITA